MRLLRVDRRPGEVAVLILALVMLATALAACSKTAPAGQGKETTMQDEIVFRDSTGKVLTLSDLRKATGTVRWEIPGDSVSQAALDRHEQGRRLGARGQYREAVAALQEAHGMAPSWPYPVYDLAFTLLLMNRQDDALDAYEQVDRLAPTGFFTTKTALWALRREKEGVFPRGTYLEYLKIEWAESGEEKAGIARKIVERAPDFAPGWQALAVRLKDAPARLRAADKGLSLNPDPETFTILTINKAIALNALGRKDEAVRLLGEVILNPPVDATKATVPQVRAALALLVGAQQQ